MPNAHLFWVYSIKERPDLPTLIQQLAQKQEIASSTFSGFFYHPKKIWMSKDFIAIYTHPNEYIDQVITWLKEEHTILEYHILQDMMALLSSINYARFLETYAEAYIEKKLPARMLIEIVSPMRTTQSPGYFLANYKNPPLQTLLNNMKSNIHLPIYFKKCITEVANGEMYWRIHTPNELSKYTPTYFKE